MKKLSAFTLLFILITSSAISQEYDFLNEGLKRLTSQRNVQINPQALDAYLFSGEKLKSSDLMLYMMNIEYQPAIYADADNNPKVIVFEEASEEAKAAKIKMFEKAKGSDFMLGETAPDFALSDLDGNKVKLSDFKGEYVLLNFWFVGCKPCIMEMPELNELVEEFEPKGINFLAIGLDNQERTTKFLDKQPFEYTLLPNGRLIASRFKVSSYPTHLLLDKEGKVIFSQQGYYPGLKYALRKRLADASEN